MIFKTFLGVRVKMRQRARAPALEKKAGKKKTFKPKTVKAVLYADCSDCRVNLKKWGQGGSIGGVMCPPCGGIRVSADVEKRRKQAETTHLAVLVNVDGTKREVDLNVDSVTDLLGGGPNCTLYHSAYALNTRALQPYYAAYIRDCALLEKLPYNLHATRVLGVLGGFHPDSSESCCGSVVFTGPEQSSLYPSEVDKIMRSY